MRSKVISFPAHRSKRKVPDENLGSVVTVPFYDEIQRLIIEVSEYFVRDHSLVYALGSSTGQILHLLSIAHRRKEDVEFIGLDLDASKFNEVAKTVNKANVRFDHEAIMNIDLLPTTFVIALFTMQFLTIAERRRLLARVNQRMVEGGGLIMVEKVHGEHPCFGNMWTELYRDFRRRQGLTAEEILQRAQSNRGLLKPLSVAENRELLHQSGFGQIDIFFKWYNWAGFLAVKTFV
jgi:tRNA (cmo5U34)-methyltransferase